MSLKTTHVRAKLTFTQLDMYIFINMDKETTVNNLSSRVGAILRKPMLIDKGKAIDLLSQYDSMLEVIGIGGEGAVSAEIARQSSLSMVSFFGAQGSVIQGTVAPSFEKVQKGSVAVVPVMGAMMRDNYCSFSTGFIAGTRELERTVMALDQNENVEGIVFQVNTPGGEARGNESLSKVIKNTETPTVVHFEGMASAGVYAFQGADEIYAAESNSYWGSIGTYVTLVDDKEFYENLGLKVLEVYAPQSTEKNKEFRDALDGDVTALREQLATMTDLFIKDVKESRPELKDDGLVFKGKLYNAIQAKKIGAIDGIKSLDFAIERARFLSRRKKRDKKKKKTYNNESTLTMETDKKLSLWDRFFGASTAEEVETDINKTETEIAALKAKVSNLEKDVASKNEVIVNLTEEKTALETKVEELTESVEASNKKFEESMAPLNEFEDCNTVADLVDGYKKAVAHNKEIAAADPDSTPINDQQLTDTERPEKTAGKERGYQDIIDALNEKNKKK